MERKPLLIDDGAKPQFFRAADPALASLPFSEAVRLGNLLFVSGQLGNVPGTVTLVAGGIAAETKQTLENVQAVLARHGSSLEHVVKVTVFLADTQEWAAFNEVYRHLFPQHFPGRSAFGVNGLALGARVELECIAYVP